MKVLASNKYLRTKRLDHTEQKGSSTYKTRAIRSLQRPHKQLIDTRPVDDPAIRGLFNGDYTED